MERIVGIVFRISFRILCDRVDSEDVTKSVLLLAARRVKSFDGSPESLDWFIRQTCFQCRMRILRRRLLWLFDVRNDIFVRATPRAEAQDDYVTKMAWQVYCRAVFRMTPLQATVYALCALEGFSRERTADILCLFVPRIEIALQKATAKIRRELAVYGREDMYGSFTDFIRKVEDARRPESEYLLKEYSDSVP